MSHESFLEDLRIENKEPAIIFTATIGLRIECVLVDVMHTADLGLTAHVVGNVFFEVISKRHFGPNLEESTAALFVDMKDWFKKNPASSRFQGRLTVDPIRARGEWPKIKAKAATTRALVGYCVELCNRFGTESLHDRRRSALVSQLARFYQILESP